VRSFREGRSIATQTTPASLPDVFDGEEYRLANPDLFQLSNTELIEHYRAFGEAEGRRANGLLSREAFAALVSPDAYALEIGPYYSPLLRGPNMKYFDVLTRSAMIERAEREGFDGSGAPEVDFVSPEIDLSIVGESAFDAVLSSHSLEHQPDLIAHLKDVERALRPGGRYFAIVPDKRYCFDHFNAESDIAEIVEAYVERRRVHTLANVLRLSVMTTHNDSIRHWHGDHGTFLEASSSRLVAGLADYEGGEGGYVDVHAWYFTPPSARAIFATLYESGYTTLELERLYPTRYGALEFWMVLRKRYDD
jgi:SAM-dependent methyltransferase